MVYTFTFIVTNLAGKNRREETVTVVGVDSESVAYTRALFRLRLEQGEVISDYKVRKG